MNTEKFLVKECAKLDLKKHATDFTGDYTEKDAAVKDFKKNIERLRERDRACDERRKSSGLS